jgi:hypothetical protein
MAGCFISNSLQFFILLLMMLNESNGNRQAESNGILDCSIHLLIGSGIIKADLQQNPLLQSINKAEYRRIRKPDSGAGEDFVIKTMITFNRYDAGDTNLLGKPIKKKPT